jgi:hypothetical protein
MSVMDTSVRIMVAMLVARHLGWVNDACPHYAAVLVSGLPVDLAAWAIA